MNKRQRKKFRSKGFRKIHQKVTRAKRRAFEKWMCGRLGLSKPKVMVDVNSMHPKLTLSKWDEKYISKPKFSVGDKVWLSQTLNILHWHWKMMPPPCLEHPMQKKITQVVKTKDGRVLYQVNGGHFPEEWIGRYVFKTEEEAKRDIKSRTMCENLNVWTVADCAIFPDPIKILEGISNAK